MSYAMSHAFSSTEKPLVPPGSRGSLPLQQKTEQPYRKPSRQPSILPGDINLAGGADAGSFTAEQQFPAPVEYSPDESLGQYVDQTTGECSPLGEADWRGGVSTVSYPARADRTRATGFDFHLPKLSTLHQSDERAG